MSQRICEVLTPTFTFLVGILPSSALRTFRAEPVKNIPRIGKLPYGAKRGFIERRVLLNKGFIEIKAFQNYENWPKC